MAFKHVCLLTTVALMSGIGLVTAPAHAATAYSVSASLSRTTVTLGGGATVSGSVYPASPGKTVTIQVRQPGSSTWTNLRNLTLSSSSRYSVAVHPTKPGATSYRVRKAASSIRSMGTSVTRTVTAWRWRSLWGMPVISFVGNVGTTVQSSVDLHGQTFSPAIIQEPEGTRLFDLSGRCSRLDAWVSGDPTSTDDGYEYAHVLGAGQADPGSYTQVIATNSVHRDGDPVHIVRGSADMLQVWSLQIYSNGVAAGNKVAWGAPRLYCRF